MPSRCPSRARTSTPTRSCRRATCRSRAATTSAITCSATCARIPAFVFNREAYRGARIVVAERNFGCGSSREHAVWALYDHGFRAAIAPSFGDIFASNAQKNGFLPIVLPEPAVGRLLAQLDARPGARIVVDLPAAGRARPRRRAVRVPDRRVREALPVEGLDEISYTLTLMPAIEAFEARLAEESPDEGRRAARRRHRGRSHGASGTGAARRRRRRRAARARGGADRRRRVRSAWRSFAAAYAGRSRARPTRSCSAPRASRATRRFPTTSARAQRSSGCARTSISSPTSGPRSCSRSWPTRPRSSLKSSPASTS